jgi:hypothetical protein
MRLIASRNFWRNCCSEAHGVAAASWGNHLNPSLAIPPHLYRIFASHGGTNKWSHQRLARLDHD